MDEASDVAANQEAKPSNENESKPEEVKDAKTEVGEEKSETTAKEEKWPESGDAVTASAADASEALVAKSVNDEAKMESGELKDEVVKEINVDANEETEKSEIKDGSKETTADEEKSPESDNADIASVTETSEAKPSEVKTEMEPGELKGEVVMEVDVDANKDGKEKQSECTENKQDPVQSTEEPAKEEEASVPAVQPEPDLPSQVALPEETPPPPVVINTASDLPPAVEKKEEPAVPSSTLAKPAESKRRGSIEKMSNFLRQFRSSGGFTKFTASQFMKVWNHYDSDGNGFIADNELDGFLREFVLSSVGESEVRPEILSESAMAIFKETFMDAFDENQDGMIDIAELAEILPTDENFLLLFHLKNPVESSVEFMKIWRQYDKDCKGYIESTELKSFLKHILDNQKTSVSDEKLEEYTETILNLFDSNRDGKLQLCEMARLMPVKQNFLSKPILKGASCITRSDIDRLFKIYDQNRNGTIEDEELSGLLKDLMDLGKKDYTLNDIENMKKVIMDHWDTDQDGTISKSELRMFLIQQCKLSAESQGLEYDDEGDDYDSDFD